MENPRSEEEKIMKDIRNLFEYKKEEENYYKPVKVNNFWNNNWIEYKSDKNKILSVEEYLNKIRLYSRDLVNDLKQSGTLKIQLAIKINFILF